jgi:hypothetical protein
MLNASRGPSCAAFDGGGPHLTNEGNAAVAKAIGAYFVKHHARRELTTTAIDSLTTE